MSVSKEEFYDYVPEGEECQCDLCQCFGYGECYDHKMNCDFCNGGNDDDGLDCPWLEEI